MVIIGACLPLDNCSIKALVKSNCFLSKVRNSIAFVRAIIELAVAAIRGDILEVRILEDLRGRLQPIFIFVMTSLLTHWQIIGHHTPLGGQLFVLMLLKLGFVAKLFLSKAQRKISSKISARSSLVFELWLPSKLAVLKFVVSYSFESFDLDTAVEAVDFELPTTYSVIVKDRMISTDFSVIEMRIIVTGPSKLAPTVG